MNFSRWEPAPGGTFSYRLFAQHHSEIRSLYWSHIPAAIRISSIVKKADKKLRPTAIFSVPRRHMKGIAPTLERWEQDYKDFNNWVRLSASVAIHSYMEMYLRNISVLAIESNPGIIIGASKAIDGVTLLKSRPDYHYSEYAIHFVKGEWNTRIQHYERLFGEAPGTLKEYVKELNELRKMRNAVGHAFGRNAEQYDSTLQFIAKPMMRLSESRFASWLRMAEEVTAAIDAHLIESHIGQYEMLLYYHRWKKKKEGKRSVVRDEVFELSSAIQADTGRVFDRNWLEGLIAYYRGC